MSEATCQEVWKSMDSAPRDGSRFIAWRVEHDGKDRCFSTVTARWDSEKFVWRDGRGILNAWTDHPPRQFNCAHFFEETIVDGVVLCGECGTMLEDLAPPANQPLPIPGAVSMSRSGYGDCDDDVEVPETSEISRLNLAAKQNFDSLVDNQRSFDLRWNASQRAIKCWQAAHPGNDLVWPDHADLCVWLMEQHALRESWKESVLVEVGQCPVESPQSRSSAYFQQCAEHLAAKLVEVQKMLVSIRDGGLIPVHFKRTHAKLAELIGLDDGRRYFDDFIDELSPAPKVGSHE